MIEEMLKKIRESEQKAAETRENGEETARSLRRKADADYSTAEEEAGKNARARREAAVAAAKRAAGESYAAQSEQAKADGEKIVSSFEAKAAELSTELYGKVISGDF